MRFAIIDNSTLTGIQRLLGQIRVKNTLVSDMDILCLESLIEAILFYDRVAFIDDYKPEFRSQRLKAFPELLALPTDAINYERVIEETTKITDTIIPRVTAGQFTDGDFKPFFELLRMNVIFTWDMASSVFWLTQKMLAGVGGVDLDKYSSLSAAIYDELLERKVSISAESPHDKRSLVCQDGQSVEIKTDLHAEYGGVAHQAEAFFAGLSWLAFRTVAYTIVAHSLGADLFLHPIRQAFQVSFIKKLHGPDESPFRSILAAMNDAAGTTLNEVLSVTQPLVTKQKIPLFVTWLAHKYQNPSCFVEKALELRSQAPFVDARKRLIEIECCLGSEQLPEKANRLVQELDQELARVKSRFSVGTNQGVSTSHLITAWNLSALVSGMPKIPNIDVRIRQLEGLKQILPPKGFNAVYRNLVTDLTRVSQLGKYHDLLTSQVVLHDDASVYKAKQEDVKYRHLRSHWKIPM